MGYIAIKGGEQAIENSLAFYRSTISERIDAQDVPKALPFAVDKIMSEGALYTQNLASLALLRSGGELFNAAFFVRAHRSSCVRIGNAHPIHTDEMRVVRRISSAFKDINGGQILGPSNDYEVKLLLQKSVDHSLWDECADTDIVVPSAVDDLRKRGVIKTLPKSPLCDITRKSLEAPYERSAVMQTLTRGETGSMLGFAYTSMRGYGDVHPTIGDLRLGMADVKFTHPFTGNTTKIGEIKLSSCEIVAMFETDEDDKTLLTTGFGVSFGYNETKVITMAILDNALYNGSYTTGKGSIVNNFDMVLHHIDAIESAGFTTHYKLPHYVTFQSDLQVYDTASNFEKPEEKSLSPSGEI